MSDAENTFEAILNRMKSSLELDITDIEGTWTGDMLQTVANELARIYSCEIKPMYDKAFVRTARGEDLDNCCADYGIVRNPATCSEGVVTLAGQPGIYKNLKAMADNIIFDLVPAEIVISDTGSVDVKCICTSPGAAGNVPAAAINRLAGAAPGVTVVNNSQTSGGYDVETDASLRSRTLEHIAEPGISGNIANYKEWALDVSGVESVQIFDLARGNGTVDVVIIADGNTVASQPLLDAVYEHIERLRPIGADVQVQAAENYNIEIIATVKARPGYSTEMLAALFYPILQKYLTGLNKRNSIISYLKIADLLFSSEGIDDVTEYTMNGQKKSIVMPDRFFPTAVMPVIRREE